MSRAVLPEYSSLVYTRQGESPEGWLGERLGRGVDLGVLG